MSDEGVYRMGRSVWQKISAGFFVLGFLFSVNPVLATGEAFSGGADQSVLTGHTVVIDDFSITGTGDDNITVNLYVESGTLAMSEATGITGDTTGNDLTFAGLRSNINNALATLTYKNNVVGNYTINATITGGNGEIYDPATGHIYEIIDSATGISWNDANTAAQGRSYGGADGYLASITSSEENGYIQERLSQNGWIGGSDAATEDDWKWVGGPDAGISFWSGDENGSVVVGQYANWNAGEPNDSGSAEDCAEFRGQDSGGWNDLPCLAMIRYYVVEYGDGVTNPSIAADQINISISNPDFDSGDGSEGDPYVISDCEQLQSIDYIEDTTDEYFALGSDVDCTMTNPEDDGFDSNGVWGDGNGFTPIGLSNGDFDGYLDGNDYTISGLFIDRANTDDVGLIASLGSGAVSDLNLTAVDITGGENVGGLVGQSDGSVTGVSVAGEVTGDESVGGIAGSITDDIDDASSSVTVAGTGSNVGGAVGTSDSGNLEDVHATGNVEGVSNVGGLVGSADSIGIYGSSASGDVTGFDDEIEEDLGNVGGLAGIVAFSLIDNSTASGDVVADSHQHVGGFAGAALAEMYQTSATGSVSGGSTVGGHTGAINCFGASIEESYATGDVTGFQLTGGFAGEIESCDPFTNAYALGAVDGNADLAGGFAASVESSNFDNIYASGSVEGAAVGGLFAESDGESTTVDYSFWDSQTSGQNFSDGGTAKTTTQMKTITTYVDDLGENAWDFADAWAMNSEVNSGYPCLQWSSYSCDEPEIVGDEITVGSCDELFNLTSENRHDRISLSKNIDCKGATVDSLFTEELPFTGVFNGKYRTIKNFVINEPENEDVGLFSAADNAEISNLYLENVTVTGDTDVGSLIGDVNENTSVQNVHAVNVSVTGSEYVGGLIGDFDVVDNESITLRNLSATGSVTGDEDNIGGLIGQTESQEGELTIQQVYADVDVSVEGEGEDIGGLFGELEADSDDDDSTVTLTDAYAWGDVSSPESELYNVGGLIGKLDNQSTGNNRSEMTIINVYASGNVSGYGSVGGLFGTVDSHEDDGSYLIENSFAMGEVDANSDFGGVIGLFDFEDNEGLTLDNVYYDQTRTGQAFCRDEDQAHDGCTAVNTDGSQSNYFINNKTNEPMASWSFNTVWQTNSNTAPTFQSDGDSDGISTADENRGPNGGDANNDGILDSEQANVASLMSAVSGRYVVLEVDDQCSIASVVIKSEADVSSSGDIDYGYPAGLFDFVIDCKEDGFDATVKQYYYGIENGTAVRKHRPDRGFFTVDSSLLSSQIIDHQTVRTALYTVKDGGLLDLDDTVNGVIKDPVGLAQQENDLAQTGFSSRHAIKGVALLLGTSLLVYIVSRNYKRVHCSNETIS